MTRIRTYNLSLWLPAITLGLFILLFVLLSLLHYHDRVDEIVRDAEHTLYENATQLANNVEYALSNAAEEQARSAVARYALRESARFAALVDQRNEVRFATQFDWNGMPAKALFDDQLTALLHDADIYQAIQRHRQDTLLTIVIPFNNRLQLNPVEELVGRKLIVQDDISLQLARVRAVFVNELLPMLLMLATATVLLVWVNRRLVITPLRVVFGLSRQLERGDLELANPLTGRTQQARVAESLVNAAQRIQSQIDDLIEREKRLDITLHSIGDAVLVTDDAGRITRMNAACCELTGWEESKALGRPMDEVFVIEDALTGKRADNPVERVLRTGEVVGLANHTVLIARDGQRHHIADSAAPIKLHCHAPISGVILVVQDVTAQYRLRQELQHNVDFLQKLMQVSPSVIYLFEREEVNGGFRLAFVSESVCVSTGERAAYWLDNSDQWLAHIHPEDRDRIVASRREACLSDTVVTSEFRFRHRDGHYITVQDHLSAVRDEQGEVTQLVGVATDISDTKRDQARQILLGDILERSLNEIYMFDSRDLHFTEVNLGARENLGYTMEELRRMTPLDLKRDLSREAFVETIRPLLDGEQRVVRFEATHWRKDGSRYPVSVNLQIDRHTDPPLLVAIIEDTSWRKHIEQQLTEEQALLRSIIDSTPDLIFCKDTQGRYLRCNKAFEAFFGATEKEILGKTDFDFVDSETAAYFVEKDRAMLSSGKSQINEETIRYPDGHTALLETLKTPFLDSNGQVLGILGISRDISEQRHAEKELVLANRVFEHSSEGILVTDSDNRIVRVNPAFCELSGYSEAEVLGRDPAMFSAGTQDADFYRNMWRAIHSQGHWSGELWNRRKNGETYLQWLSISTITDENGQLQNYLAVLTDITKFREAEDQISFLAHHDVLTRLPNRELLRDRMRQAMISADRHNHKLALLYLDLDRFKFINDSLGHAIGDDLLKAVAERLLAQVREQDTVCRTGGDEFIVLLPDTDADGAAHVADKLVESLSKPFLIRNNELFVTLSIGISIYPDNGPDAETLNKHADTAMYRAKHAGRNQYQFFTEEMHSQMVHKIELEHALRFALERDELELYYQPQLEIRSRRLMGTEALLRWKHPRYGYISPLEFIPIAEETGLINSIGDWVLREAIGQCRHWRRQGHDDLVMAINLSAVQFNNPMLVERISTILAEHALPAANLELEITESVAMMDIDLTIRQMRALSAAGIRLALDDFGTGYSSLNYLKKFPISKLKIDQGFVFDMLEDDDDAAIVDAVITLAKTLGLKTLAEGVETEHHLQALRQKGCDYAQGYLFSKPLTADDFSALLEHFPPA